MLIMLESFLSKTFRENISRNYEGTSPNHNYQQTLYGECEVSSEWTASGDTSGDDCAYSHFFNSSQ